MRAAFTSSRHLFRSYSSLLFAPHTTNTTITTTVATEVVNPSGFSSEAVSMPSSSSPAANAKAPAKLGVDSKNADDAWQTITRGVEKVTVHERFEILKGPLKTFDPFLFCMHHADSYPAAGGDENSLGPNPAFLTSRDIGSDFSYTDGWSMYHGQTVPGFPEHPHRGFETITIVQEGFVDHSDSIKCTARYGNGDTQWMTAGKGIQHAEMFPLLHRDKPNPLNLFQVWLNLPAKEKMCDPFFSMSWDEVTTTVSIPALPPGKGQITIRVIAGELFGAKPAVAPPPSSWAANESHDVGIWLVKMPATTGFVLPAAKGGAETTRTLYFVEGKELVVGDAVLSRRCGVRISAEKDAHLQAPNAPATVLVLQGKPIKEPVVQHGPFVMNTREEIVRCFDDFRRTQFGGWPWTASDHCHSRETPRHAVHPNGKKEFPPNSEAAGTDKQKKN